MPDRRFDGQKAQLHVHRVQPKYQHGRCAQTPVRAAVLIHGRTVPGPVAFDLKGADQDHNKLSVQAGLAREGIDTFAPSLLGYGQSTRFKDGLDDPDNASLRAFRSDGSCAFAEGCDRTHNPVFPLDQQGTKLSTNPLAGQRYAHSSKVRFAGTDVWVRDVRQAIDDAIAKAHPTDGKVTLLGYSLGGNRVGRALYANNPNPLLPKSSDTIAKVNRVVFLSSFYGGTTEESTPSGGFVSFPLTLTDHQGTSDGWKLASGTTEQDCPGRIVNGSQDETWKELMQQDGRGRDWGGTDPPPPRRPQPLADLLHLWLEQHRRGAADGAGAGHPRHRRRRPAGDDVDHPLRPASGQHAEQGAGADQVREPHAPGRRLHGRPLQATGFRHGVRPGPPTRRGRARTPHSTRP
ncbi:hypothetical protein GCM10020000_46650 [Streptomyces olivoverticillatus]